MRLLFVVQRYGHEVAGGAERHCREFATRLAERGHEPLVATTCAAGYRDWADEYPAGESVVDGVPVLRFPVARRRDVERFATLDARVVGSDRTVPRHLERAWMEAQGPRVPELVDWLRARARGFDVVVFFTYLYFTAWAGLRAVAGVVPTVLHPTAHDEAPLRLSIFDTLFRLPTALALSTPEEQALVTRRFGPPRLSSVVGVGVEAPRGGDVAAFRERFGLGDRPYLLFVGRLDPGKGTVELVEFFEAYKRRRPGPLALVLLGDPVAPVSPGPDVVVTGFVDEATKVSALEGCLALAQPSYFESFSMVLTEAWAASRPALVQGRCEVLAGQARRSGGAIPYRGYAQFEAALDAVTGDAGLADRLGAAGRRYVEREYAWPVVLDRYEELLEAARTAGA